jgi:hypothetical protein
METWRDSIKRARLENPGVRLRKIGVLPSGFTIGNKADTTSRQLLRICRVAESGMPLRIQSLAPNLIMVNAALPPDRFLDSWITWLV